MATDLRAVLRGPVWLLVAPTAAGVALVVDAPPAVGGVLALLGLIVAAERLAALRRSGTADRLLVVTGGLLVVLVLTGLALDVMRLRLGPSSWTAALIVLTVVGLALVHVVPARDTAADGSLETPRATGHRGRGILRTLPWAAAAVLVTVVAVRMSATSLSASDAAPLQMSIGAVTGNRVDVVVSSSEPIGPLELRTSSGGTDISYPLFTLGADGTSTTELSVPATGRYVITLNYPDQTEPLRTLVVDR